MSSCRLLLLVLQLLLLVLVLLLLLLVVELAPLLVLVLPPLLVLVLPPPLLLLPPPPLLLLLLDMNDCIVCWSSASSKRVQQDLGDLEAVCQDTAVLWPKLLQLPQLPQLALYQLLYSLDTRVASEETVIYVIQSWAAAEQQQPAQQQMKQLCSTIYLSNCSPLYLVSVLAAWPLLVQCFTPQDLARAAVCATSVCAINATKDHPPSPASAAGLAAEQLLIRNRPQSASSGPLDLEHAVPLRQLEAAVTAALAEGAAQPRLNEAVAYRWSIPAWQGRSFSVWLQAVPATSSPALAAAEAAPPPPAAAAAAAAAAADAAPPPAAVAGSSILTLFVTFGDDMPQDAAGVAGLLVRVLPAPAGANFDDAAEPPAGIAAGNSSAPLHRKEHLRMCFSAPGFCGVSPFSSYAECERQLRQKGLVHPDRTLRLQLQLFIKH
uniref:BACK domain-containing protein n=1 Tax=Tetradesmus obliquus TaxID=3088 RepID=A0A383VQB8_TETOB|eukprot:jgi/Sobl393_1/13977/SZX66924.1